MRAMLLIALLATPALAEIPPALEAAIRACAVPDMTFDARVAALTAVGGTILEGDARVPVAEATLLGAGLIFDAYTGEGTPTMTLREGLAELPSTARREAAIVPDGLHISDLTWVALDEGAIGVRLFVTSKKHTDCQIIGPAVSFDDLSATFTRAENIQLRSGPLGTVTAWHLDGKIGYNLIEGYLPNSDAIAPVWSRAVPGSFFRITSMPTIPVP